MHARVPFNLDKEIGGIFIYGTLEEQTTFPNIFDLLFSTYDMPLGTLEYLCDLSRCVFHNSI